ncbi:hypothetical protein ABFV47_01380 [Mycolicibacterium fortuitum]
MTKGITAQVVGIMFDRANMDGTEVYINNQKLALELGCNEKSIRRARKDIETKGLAVLEKRGIHFVNGGSRPSVYRLTMPGSTQPDIVQVSPQPDISVYTTGHSLHNRTSVSTQPDMGVHLIDPGNKPGSLLSNNSEEPDTDVSGDASRPVEGSDSRESETVEAVSSSGVQLHAYSSDPWGSEPSTGTEGSSRDPEEEWRPSGLPQPAIDAGYSAVLPHGLWAVDSEPATEQRPEPLRNRGKRPRSFGESMNQLSEESCV